MYYAQLYAVDWDKVTTLEDIKRILKLMGPTFEPNIIELGSVKDLLFLRDKTPWDIDYQGNEDLP